MSDQRGPTVAVTGAGGFVGSAVVRHLRGCAIKVIPSARIPGANAAEGMRVLDLLQPQTIAAALAGAEVVVHAAGLAHQFGHGSRCAPFMQVNAEGTANLTREAARCGVRHLILLSSVSVYGAHGSASVDEEFPCHPATPYAASKLEAEGRAVRIAQQYGLGLTVLRLATVYGEGDRGNIARLMRAIDRHRFVWIGDGRNRKSLVHCDDVARACVAALTPPAQSPVVYNVSAPPCSVRDIVEALGDALGVRVPGWCVPPAALRSLTRAASFLTARSAPVERISGVIDKWLADDVYDGSRMQRAYMFDFAVGLEDGLRREVQWYRRARR